VPRKTRAECAGGGTLNYWLARDELFTPVAGTHLWAPDFQLRATVKSGQVSVTTLHLLYKGSLA